MSTLTPEQQAPVLRTSKHKDAFRILEWFASVGAKGGTADECEAALVLRHHTASPRISELASVGCLALTGGRRGTRSGRTAAVYAFQKGSSFSAYLGIPKGPKKASLTTRERGMLAAAKAYVKARPKAKSSKGVRAIVVRLLHSLNDIASVP